LPCFLRIFTSFFPSHAFAILEEEEMIYQLELLTQPDNGYAGDSRLQDRLDGVNAYPTFFSMSTNASTTVVVSRAEITRHWGRVQNVQIVPIVQALTSFLPRVAGEDEIGGLNPSASLRAGSAQRLNGLNVLNGHELAELATLYSLPTACYQS
jgi:hypothetical protein